MKFKDYFSNFAAQYAAYRPHYPAALFKYLSELVSHHDLAWDCGTGNGQVAVELASYFKQVIATDASAQQIKFAAPKSNVDYRVMPAEKTNIAARSIDLICVAQALHWFDFDKFYAEVKRVLKPDGVIAVWCYDLVQLNEIKLDEIVAHLYKEITDPYWAPERAYIDQRYETIPFPFVRQPVPTFVLEETWDFKHFINYLNTWSGLQNYRQQQGDQELEKVFAELLQIWGNPENKKRIQWPLYLLIGQIVGMN